MPLLKGWEIDLGALHGRRWSDREKWHLREELWESPDGRLAGVLYRIAKVGVSKGVGRLAVFRNKERPELLLNLPNLECWYLHRAGVQFGGEGILFVHRFKSGFRRLGVRLCALDVTTKALCPLAQHEERFYDTSWIDQKKYGFRKMDREVFLPSGDQVIQG